jgi:hypothetical protein
MTNKTGTHGVLFEDFRTEGSKADNDLWWGAAPGETITLGSDGNLFVSSFAAPFIATNHSELLSENGPEKIADTASAVLVMSNGDPLEGKRAVYKDFIEVLEPPLPSENGPQYITGIAGTDETSKTGIDESPGAIPVKLGDPNKVS